MACARHICASSGRACPRLVPACPPGSKPAASSRPHSRARPPTTHAAVPSGAGISLEFSASRLGLPRHLSPRLRVGKRADATLDLDVEVLSLSARSQRRGGEQRLRGSRLDARQAARAGAEAVETRVRRSGASAGPRLKRVGWRAASASATPAHALRGSVSWVAPQCCGRGGQRSTRAQPRLHRFARSAVLYSAPGKAPM